MNLDAHRQAAGIHHAVAFSAVELLRPVIAVGAAALRGLKRLTAEDRSLRLLSAPGDLAHAFTQAAAFTFKASG